jgi:hypothetical protein
LGEQGVEVVALTQANSPSAPPSTIGLAGLRPVLPQLVPPQRGFLRRSLAAVPRLRRAASDCDLLHVVAEPYALAALWSAGNRPLVVTAHGTYVPQTARRRIVGRLYRRAYRRAALIAVSEYTAAQVRAALPGATMTVIRNGVRFDRFQVPAPAPPSGADNVARRGGVAQGRACAIEALAQVARGFRCALSRPGRTIPLIANQPQIARFAWTPSASGQIMKQPARLAPAR